MNADSTSAASIELSICHKPIFLKFVFGYITRIGSKFRSKNESAIILYNGLKDHIPQHSFSLVVIVNINILVLPSRSSHTAQKIDQYFSDF